MDDDIRSVEHLSEQIEFHRQDFEEKELGLVVLGEKVDDGDRVFLAVTMAPPDPLFNALRVPRQVVVDQRLAELKVQALGAGFGGDEDRRSRLELVNQCESLAHL